MIRGYERSRIYRIIFMVMMVFFVVMTFSPRALAEGDVTNDGCTEFDEETGTLYLFGNVDSASVKAFNYDNNDHVYHVVAREGTVLPENCSSLFKNFKVVQTIDLSQANTGNATTMSGMFYGCEAMTSIDVSGFKTSAVTNMENMFRDCENLLALDLSGFDTSSVLTMMGMFCSCEKLESLNVKSFNTSNVINMYEMFYDCRALTALDVSSFDTSSVQLMSGMFNGLHSLTSLDLKSFNTSSVTDMARMFGNCTILTDLDLSSFNTSNVTTMAYMFFNCTLLPSLDLSRFNTSQVTSMREMFNACKNLENVNMELFDTSSVTTMEKMFYDCKKLTILDLSSFEIPNLRNMASMFSYCSALKTVYVSTKWNTKSVTTSTAVFLNDFELEGGNGTKFSTTKIYKSYARIDTPENPGYFTETPKRTFPTDLSESYSLDVGADKLFKVDGASDVDQYGYKWYVIDGNGKHEISECLEKGWFSINADEHFDDQNELKLERISAKMDGKSLICYGAGPGEITYTSRIALISMTKQIVFLDFDLEGFEVLNNIYKEGQVTGKTVKAMAVKVLEGSPYSGTLSVECKKNNFLWMSLGDGDEVKGGTQLRFTIAIAAASGYSINRTKHTVRIHGMDATVTRFGTSFRATIEYVVPKPPYGIMLETVSESITEPKAGEAPATALLSSNLAEANATRNYEVSSLSWAPEVDTFVGGESYTLTIRYKAKSDYGFYEDTEFLINGNQMEVEELVKGDGGTATVSYKFNVPLDKGVIRSVSTSFSGMLELNFYCEMPEEILADEGAYVTMTAEGGNSVKTLVKNAKDKKIGDRKAKFFAYPLVAKQMRDDVTFRLFNGNDEEIALRSGNGKDYGKNGCPMSVYTYCNMVIDANSDAKMVALAKAMIDYGTATQLYFGYNADGLSVSNLVKNLDQQTVIDAFPYVITGEKPAGFDGFKSISLVLESATALRIYCGYEENVGAGRFAYTVDDSGKKITKTNDGKCYLEVINIAAKDLDNRHTFTVTLGKKTLKLEVSALSYAAILCKETKSKPVNLGKAMYLYNQAAEAYFKK